MDDVGDGFDAVMEEEGIYCAGLEGECGVVDDGDEENVWWGELSFERVAWIGNIVRLFCVYMTRWPH